MKLLDRYVAGLYVSAFGIFTVAFLLLYILVDFVPRADDFFTLPYPPAQQLVFCATYYAVRVPLFLTILLPIVTLFAAMFTCHRLARNNEFIPAIAAGVSIRRMTAPFFIAAVVVTSAIGSMEEWVLPGLGSRILQTENTLRRGDTEHNVFVSDRRGDSFYFFTYVYSGWEARRAVVALFGPERKIERLVMAERGVCEAQPETTRPGRWRFRDGAVTRFTAALERDTAPLPPEGFALETDLDPINLSHGERVGTTFYSLSDLKQLIHDNPRTPLFRVRFHHRLAAPLGSVLLLLIGIPFIALTQRQNLFIGVGICLMICGGYYVMQFLCLDGGVRGDLRAAVAGWLPTGVFGLLGSVLFFWKLKT